MLTAMIVTWMLLAPAAALASVLRWTAVDVRRWRSGEIGLNELLGEVAFSGLYLSLGAGAILSPVTAGIFLAAAAWIEGGTLKRLVSGRRPELPPPNGPPDRSG